jgi:hypothetical protein
MTVRVPIAEWAGSGTVNLAQNDVEYAYNSGTWNTSLETTSFGYGPAGAAMGGALSNNANKYVRFSNISATDSLIIELSDDRVIWVPSTFAIINANAVINSMDATGALQSGVILAKQSTNTVLVVFGRYMNVASDGSPAIDWPSNTYWRVRKTSAGAAVGFGTVVPGVSAGLVPAAGLPGRTDGQAVAAGYVGQYVPWDNVSGTYSATSTINPGTEIGNGTQRITLAKGRYRVDSTIHISGVASSSVLYSFTLTAVSGSFNIVGSNNTTTLKGSYGTTLSAQIQTFIIDVTSDTVIKHTCTYCADNSSATHYVNSGFATRIA